MKSSSCTELVVNHTGVVKLLTASEDISSESVLVEVMGIDEDDGPKDPTHRRWSNDEDIERRRRNEIREALRKSSDGLGFNELHDQIELLAREPLRKRLEKYEKSGWIDMPQEVQPGKKKKIQLTKSGTRPKNLDEDLDKWRERIVGIWITALDQYRADEQIVDYQETANYVLTERFRWDYGQTVIPQQIGIQESLNLENVELPVYPEIDPGLSVEQFYLTIAAELYKFYTEKTFGEAYIQTAQKSDRLRKDITLELYTNAANFRDESIELWKESPVPTPDDV